MSERGGKQQRAHGEYHRLSVSRRLDSCSLGFFRLRELEWWRCAGLQEPKQLSVFELTSLKLSHFAVHVFHFSSYSIPEDMLKWSHQPLPMKIPSCMFLLFTQSLCWSRKERTEFSILQYTRAWLHSLNIIYIHGFLPSAILEKCVLSHESKWY